MPEIERRGIWGGPAEVSVEVRGEKELRVRGYAAVFNAETQLFPGFREVVRPGAFTRTVAEDEIVALFNHDPNFPLGSTGSRRLRVWEDDHGLAFELLGPFSPTIRDLVVDPIRNGDVQGASFGFFPRDAPESEQDGHVLRELRDVRLQDVSPVTFPAYQATEVGLRSWARARLEGVDTRGEMGHDSPEGPSGPHPRRAVLERELEDLQRDIAD